MVLGGQRSRYQQWRVAARYRQVPFLEDVAQIVISHEERFDGSGSPRRLARDAIPFGARLFAVIDTLMRRRMERSASRGRQGWTRELGRIVVVVQDCVIDAPI